MREILFRGIDIGTQEWVYGYYCERPSPSHIGKEYSIFDDKTISRYTIRPETVGQFTGLTDKNGKKIFEGDIVVLNVKGNNTICTVSWAETVAQFQLWQINTIPKTPTALNLGNYDCEIIGNIHDNPELLEAQ